MATPTPKEVQEQETPQSPEANADIPEFVPVYNINDGLIGRNGGPYLDEELAKEQEVRNARAEKREPDFTNLAAAPSPGIQLVTKEQMLSANASRIGVGLLNGDISAPVYGYVENPIKTLEDQTNAQEAALKKSSELDPRSNVEAPEGAAEPDNGYGSPTTPPQSGEQTGKATGNTR